MKTEQNQYTLKKEPQQDVYALCRGGVPCNCPYQPALVLPGSVQGTAQITRLSCNTGCALFQMTGIITDEKCTVSLKCAKDFTLSVVPFEKEVNKPGRGLTDGTGKLIVV